MNDASDHELMARYANGDADAFECLYHRHKGRLYGFLRQRIFDPQAADDVYQEVWAKVIRARRQYEPDAPFASWLFQIARNACIDHMRHGERRVTLVTDTGDSIDNASGATTPHESASALDTKAAIDAAIASLPDEQREAFLLHQVAGLSLPDIARVTGAKRETVKSRLRYALSRLRAALPNPHQQDVGT
ncbi:MAG: RNA polymerase sigma factor [Pseudomonadota bacterium]